MADLLHVKAPTFRSWVNRHETTGCPLPVNTHDLGVKTGPLWDASEVIRWWTEWQPIKSRKLGKLGHVDAAILKELGLNRGANNGE